MHGSKSEFGALGIVLAISPSSDLEIMHDRSWAILWVHFGSWFGFLVAHHESIWILGGEASWKLKGVSLHGELVRRVIGECGFEVEGLFSRAECM
ncbi:hypothetical protein CK203_117463 [Vitis vinifera]|uniref:Uncharacterized protein n=1 Tax=Vitis vinifera TaxID=29760 RepID=A0A438FCI0_VITVI|nr:hypothetical protein CK203_117463 [Vitis vinifera]